MTKLAILIQAFLAIVLGGVIAMESNPDKLRGPVQVPRDIVRLGPATPHAGDLKQVQSWVDIILARPLFEPSRRPPATAAGSGPSGSGFPRLTGIIILPQQREAIFAVPGKTQPIVVTAGSRLNGVLIKSIEVDSIVVVDGAGTRIIRPSFAAGGASAPSASASIMVDPPPVPAAPPHALPFASIHGLSGRPLGLVAQPDTTTPSLPALAPPGGSP